MCPEDFLHAVTFCMQACLLTSVSHATVIVIAVVGIIIKKKLDKHEYIRVKETNINTEQKDIKWYKTAHNMLIA